MLSRVADSVFWLSRYIERAENIARFLDVNLHLTLDLGDSARIRPIGNIRLAISPDGRRVAFIGNEGADAALWVREFDQPEARRLPDTRGAFAPFFSPDGKSIGFFTAAGGPPTTLCNLSCVTSSLLARLRAIPPYVPYKPRKCAQSSR